MQHRAEMNDQPFSVPVGAARNRSGEIGVGDQGAEVLKQMVKFSGITVVNALHVHKKRR
jgi:hypothetical protein